MSAVLPGAPAPPNTIAMLIDDAWAGLSLLEDVVLNIQESLDQRTRDRLRFVMHGMLEALDEARDLAKQ